MISEELSGMSPEELGQRLVELQEELSNLRFQKALQQLEGTHQLSLTKKFIAQVKTLQREYQLGIRTGKAE